MDPKDLRNSNLRQAKKIAAAADTEIEQFRRDFDACAINKDGTMKAEDLAELVSKQWEIAGRQPASESRDGHQRKDRDRGYKAKRGGGKRRGRGRGVFL